MQGGFSHGEDGKLRDAQGRPVAFSLAFNAGNDHQKRMAAVIQEDLRVLGMGVTLVPLEFRSLVDRILHRRDFDAAILALSGDLDPNTSLNTWSSSGSGHFWRLQGEAEEWEQEIDRLLQQQKAALDLAERKRLFDRVQEILAEQQPFIFLISPNVLVGARRGLGNFRPTNLDQPTLWNAEELFWQGATAPTVR
jgi:peptide/nickel transport system substrate-binding protein